MHPINFHAFSLPPQSKSPEISIQNIAPFSLPKLCCILQEKYNFGQPAT